MPRERSRVEDRAKVDLQGAQGLSGIGVGCAVQRFDGFGRGGETITKMKTDTEEVEEVGRGWMTQWVMTIIMSSSSCTVDRLGISSGNVSN